MTWGRVFPGAAYQGAQMDRTTTAHTNPTTDQRHALRAVDEAQADGVSHSLVSTWNHGRVLVLDGGAWINLD